MSSDLKNKSFLKLLDFTRDEILFLLNLSMDIKRKKYKGLEKKLLKGKKIALIFEKTSTRTRCAFEAAAHDQGATVTYISSKDSQLGKKESIKDTARVLSRFFDAIEYRGFEHKKIEEFAEYASVPVINGLTDGFHPTQVLADFLTMKEHSKKPLNKIKFAYIGDARNNMGNSLLTGAAKLGMNFITISPKSLMQKDDLIFKAEKISKKTGAHLTFTDNIKEVLGCDFIYTDIWVSMGEPDAIWEERIKLLLPYRVDKKLMKLTKNPHIKFMHCLPSFHNKETETGENIYKKFGLNGLEVTEEVFESKASIVFDQAENRLHTIKGVLVALLSD